MNTPWSNQKSSGAARVVTFVGASGGIGTSCLVASVAGRAASRGLRVACVDTDAGGGGLDVVLGMDHLPGLRWPDLLGAHGDLSPDLLLRELPQEGGVWVLSHSRETVVDVPVEAETTLLRAVTQGVDLVLVDGGRARPRSAASRGGPTRGGGRFPSSGLGPGVLDARSWAFSDEVVLVVGATPQSLAAATVIVGAVPEHGPRWWLAQRTPKTAEHLPETVQAALGLAVVVAVGEDKGCDAALVAGQPPGRRGALGKAAEQLLSVVTHSHVDGRRVA